MKLKLNVTNETLLQDEPDEDVEMSDKILDEQDQQYRMEFESKERK